MKEELLKGLTKKQIAKIVACKNQEELLKVAKEEGITLLICPNCGMSVI